MNEKETERERQRDGEWLWEITINHSVISFNKDCLEYQLCQTLLMDLRVAVVNKKDTVASLADFTI